MDGFQIKSKYYKSVKINFKMLKINFISLLLILFALPTISSAQKKPNVIVVITDDQGFNDLSCMGNPYIKPQISISFMSNPSGLQITMFLPRVHQVEVH